MVARVRGGSATVSRSSRSAAPRGENFGYLLEARLIVARTRRLTSRPVAGRIAPTEPGPAMAADRFAQPAGAVRLEALAEASLPQWLGSRSSNSAGWRGRLAGTQSIDFIAQQGQTLVFDVISAQLAQLTDPSLVIDKWIERWRSGGAMATGCRAGRCRLPGYGRGPSAAGRPAIVMDRPRVGPLPRELVG